LDNLKILSLLLMIVGLVPTQTALAQVRAGIDDPELSAISDEIYAQANLNEQLRKQGQPLPASAKTKILSRFYPYSASLTEDEISLAFVVVSAIRGVIDDEPLSADDVDSVIGWMIAKGWGQQVLVHSSQNANIDSAQFERLIDGLLGREEPLDVRRQKTIERIVVEGRQSAADIDKLGSRLLSTNDDVERRILIDWLMHANGAGKLDQSPVAARALLLNASHVWHAQTQLAPLLTSSDDPEILLHLARLAVAEDSADLAALLMTVELPDKVLLTLQPLASSNDRSLRRTVANAIAQRFGAGDGGTEWLLSTTEDSTAPELLRITSLKQLAKQTPSLRIRVALLKHYNGDVRLLRVEALRALRSYELSQAMLEEATLDVDADVQREAWQQLDRRFDETMPISSKWQLYPSSRRQDVGMAIALVAAVSAAIMALTALLTPIVVGALWKSLALFLVGAAASAVSWGFLVIVAIASQHQNGFADTNVQQILCVIIFTLWVVTGFSWFSAVKASRRRQTNGEPEISHQH